jgi:hypothetical protein
MNNDELDELLRDAAATYNAPPDAPREAMWAAISGAREASTVIPIARPRHAPRWLAGAAGIAAVLLVGIAIGRQMTPVQRTDTAAIQRTASVPSVTAPATNDSSENPSATEPLLRQPSARLSAKDGRTGTPRGRTAHESNSAGDVASDQTAYRLAVVEHLTRTEVLLTSFRARENSESAEKLDAQFAAASRELLSTTRLLLAVHRADDPTMTRLLQDLEYVLMQISQYAADGRRVDLEAINQSLDRRNVLPKLRSTIPAGVSASSSNE